MSCFCVAEIQFFFVVFYRQTFVLLTVEKKDQSVGEQYRAAIRLECFERAAGGTL